MLWRSTYAAVAAKISTGLAFVNTASAMENRAEKPRTAPSLATMSCMSYKDRTATVGNRVDIMTMTTRAIVL